jgi:hypothetical protein
MRLLCIAALAFAALSAAPPEPLRNSADAVLRGTPDRDLPSRCVVIDPTSFVPLILGAPPESRHADRGWTALNVTLAREHVKTLEDFSRSHPGGQVDIVLDCEIVTIHKVRSVVTDGHFQLTRCLDDACRIVKSKLEEKK